MEVFLTMRIRARELPRDTDFQKLDAEMLKTEEGKRAASVLFVHPTFDFCPGSTNEFQTRAPKTGETRGSRTARERFGKFESVDESWQRS